MSTFLLILQSAVRPHLSVRHRSKELTYINIIYINLHHTVLTPINIVILIFVTQFYYLIESLQSAACRLSLSRPAGNLRRLQLPLAEIWLTVICD